LQPLPPEPEQPTWNASRHASASVRAGEIHVWRAAIPAVPSAALEATVSEAELRYAERMTSDTARRQFIAAQAALRTALARYLDEPPAAIRFRRGEHGKPFLESDHGADSLQFNLSHSHDLAVVAVTRGAEIGVDLEKVRERPSAERLAARFFAEGERAALAAVSAAEKERMFFRLWTRKESHIKATGTGLSVNLRAIDTLAPEPPWWYHEFAAAADYVAALAGTSAIRSITYHELEPTS
jgi:4'-phosphopantetheinyl transferase